MANLIWAAERQRGFRVLGVLETTSFPSQQRLRTAFEIEPVDLLDGNSNLRNSTDEADISGLLDFLHNNPRGKFKSVTGGNATQYTESREAAAGCASYLTTPRFYNKNDRERWGPHADALDDRIKQVAYPDVLVDDIDADMAYMKTDYTMAQDPHFDNDTEHVRDLIGRGLPVPKTALVAIDPAGYYIEVFEGGKYIMLHGDDGGQQDITHTGQLLFVPYGHCLIIPSYVIHAGGFYSADSDRGNSRLHYYLRDKNGQHPSGNQLQYEKNGGRPLTDDFHHVATPIALRESGLFQLVRV